jgi:hypothetical protein
MESQITTITNYIIAIGRVVSLFDEQAIRCQGLDFLCKLKMRLEAEGLALNEEQKKEVQAHIADAERLLGEQQ